MAEEQALVKERGSLGDLQQLLEKHKAQIVNALPKHMTAERMIRIAMTAVSGSPELMRCQAISLAACIVQASILGLEPNSVLGEAYLVPFWNKKAKNPDGSLGAYQAQLIPGYLGLVKLARNTGEVSMIDAQPVYEHDFFEFEKGSEVYWRHKWERSADRGKVQGYWAGYVLKDGAKNFEYWTVKQIEEHRDRYSKGAYDRNGNLQGPWKDSPDWMYRKTPLRQVIKLMPKSVELSTAIALDERAESRVGQVFVDVPLALHPPVEEPDDDTAEVQNPNPKEKLRDKVIAKAAEKKAEKTEEVAKESQ